MNILKLFTQEALTKVLLVVVLLLGTMTFYNHHKLKLEQARLEKVVSEYESQKREIDKLNKSIETLHKHSEAVDTATRNINTKINELEKKNKSYNTKVEELGRKDDDVKKVLDTKLPDDLKRLLDESIKP